MYYNIYVYLNYIFCIILLSNIIEYGKSKIIVDTFLINKIANSTKIDNDSKISFLKYMWYMTWTERRELIQLI